MQLSVLSSAGGLFAWCVLIHFLVDWLTQSHKEAMSKHNHFFVRTKHCLIYAAGFLPLMYLFGFTPYKYIIGLLILFVSHHLIDTYISTFLWMKYIRHPPAFDILYPNPKNNKWEKDDHKAMTEFISTPIGMILLIVVDQLTHFIFLIPICYLALS
jgi:hypothetical protein